MWLEPVLRARPADRGDDASSLQAVVEHEDLGLVEPREAEGPEREGGRAPALEGYGLGLVRERRVRSLL